MRKSDKYPELTAHLLDVLLRNDRKIRPVGPPRTRQEWGIDRCNLFVRAIGRDTLEEDGEQALWTMMRESVALLPARRKEALARLVGLWSPFDGWLDDQDVPAPTRPEKYRLPDIERLAG
jgi:hypothetical protein